MQISIEPLRCGTLTRGLNMFEAGASRDPVSLPIPSWLIRHPDGLVLVDCGMHADLTSPGDYLNAISVHFEVGLTADELVAQALARVDVGPGDIDIVILSHLHFDHVGGLGQIPNARVIVQADEWAAGANDELAAANTFIQADYQLGHDVIQADGEHDVFGDGSVACIPTPGHTPGHQSVRIRLSGSEIVLCGDCAYFERTLDGGALPPFGYDREQQAASIRLLRDMHSAGATLIPGHDATVFARLPAKIV